MKRLYLFAAVAGIGLVSAAPPPSGESGSGAAAAWSGYPPCSRTVTDRCIQLYERGVRTRENLARNERLSGAGSATAMGGPYEAAAAAGTARSAGGDYPPCSATVTDRCMQMGGRTSTRRTRMAGEQIRMAGERG